MEIIRSQIAKNSNSNGMGIKITTLFYDLY